MGFYSDGCREPNDEMGVQISLPDKQMQQVQKLGNNAVKGIYVLAGAFAGIAAALAYAGYCKKRG